MGDEHRLLPVPRAAVVNKGRFRLGKVGLTVGPKVAGVTVSDLCELLKSRAGRAPEQAQRTAPAACDTRIDIEVDREAGRTPCPGHEEDLIAIPHQAPEAYTLDITQDGELTRVVLKGRTPAAAGYALATFKQLVSGSGAGTHLPEVRLRDWPGFDLRAVKVGPPLYLPVEERKRRLAFFADHKFNVVFFSKRFCEENHDWTRPFTAKQLRYYADVTGYLRPRFVEPCVHMRSLSGRRTFRFSSKRDRDVMFRKFDSLYDAGMRWFSLTFGDFGGEPFAREDKKAYGNLTEAHIDWLRAVYEYLKEKDSGSELIVVPSVYANRARSSASLIGQLENNEGITNRQYLQRLGRRLPAGMYVYWTGPYIRSPLITDVDAQQHARLIKRKPFVFDNNFYGYGFKAIRGRTADLGEFVSGHMANLAVGDNPMAVPAAMTVADYLWNPEDYDHERSFKTAVERMLEPREAGTYLSFMNALWLDQIVYGGGRFGADEPSAPVESYDVAEWCRGIRRLGRMVPELNRTISDPELRQAMRDAVRLLYDSIRSGKVLAYRSGAARKTGMMERALDRLRKAVESVDCPSGRCRRPGAPV